MATLKGSTSTFEDVQQEVVWNEYGICNATMYYNGPYDSLDSNVGETHPKYSSLKRKSARLVRTEAGMGQLSVTYEGVPPPGTGGSGGSSDPSKSYSAPRYSCKISVYTSPIETHPHFRDWAGTALTRVKKYGATFDSRGRFSGFIPTENEVVGGDGRNYSKAGVKGFEEVGLIWEESRLHTATDTIATTDNDVGNVGRVVVAPPGFDKFFKTGGGTGVGGRNFLYIGADIEQIGFGYKIVKKWRMSGYGGWDPDIYGRATGN